MNSLSAATLRMLLWILAVLCVVDGILSALVYGMGSDGDPLLVFIAGAVLGVGLYLTRPDEGLFSRKDRK